MVVLRFVYHTFFQQLNNTWISQECEITNSCLKGYYFGQAVKFGNCMFRD